MPLRALVVLVTLFALSGFAQAYHADCPASESNVTLRVLDGGLYLRGAELWQETNGHSGLQQGALPAGCAPDTRIA